MSDNSNAESNLKCKSCVCFTWQVSWASIVEEECIWLIFIIASLCETD